MTTWLSGSIGTSQVCQRSEVIMKRKQRASVLLGLASVLFASCTKESLASGPPNAASHSAGQQTVSRAADNPQVATHTADNDERVRAAFLACPLVERKDSPQYSQAALVCVIGENHAKVASQIELADTIE